MKLDFKKNEKLAKIITVILVGLLILICIAPLGNNNTKTAINSGSDNKTEYDSHEVESYYEQRLKSILESSYGAGTMEVMVNVVVKKENKGFYNDSTESYEIDGVLVVARLKDSNAAAEISFAVCALFGLPAHKVAVVISK